MLNVSTKTGEDQFGERVWQGVEEFKKAMETSDIPLENVHFVTWYDDYEKNTEELTKSSILEPWKPLDTSGFEIMDEQYKRKQLDPSLSNLRHVLPNLVLAEFPRGREAAFQGKNAGSSKSSRYHRYRSSFSLCSY